MKSVLKTECSTKERRWECLWCDIQVVKHIVIPQGCSAQKKKHPSSQKQNFGEVNSVIFVFRFLFYWPQASKKCSCHLIMRGRPIAD